MSIPWPIFVLSFPWAALVWPLPWFVFRFLSSSNSTLPSYALGSSRFLNTLQPSLGKLKAGMLWFWLGGFWSIWVLAWMQPALQSKPTQWEHQSPPWLWIIDVSPSMDELMEGTSQTRFEASQKAATTWISQAKSAFGDTPMGVMIFGFDALPYLPLTYDWNKVSQAIEHLELGLGRSSANQNGSALLDALMASLDRLGDKARGSTWVLLSDGEDRSSASQIGEVTQSLAKHGVHLNIFSFAAKKGPGEALLQRLAKDSGGQWFPVKRQADLALPLEKLRGSLSKQPSFLLVPLSGYLVLFSLLWLGVPLLPWMFRQLQRYFANRKIRRAQSL